MKTVSKYDVSLEKYALNDENSLVEKIEGRLEFDKDRGRGLVAR